MKQRIQKILSSHGVSSRRAAERMIAQGRITVNGRVAVPGDSADPSTDRICVDRKPLPKRDEAVYLMLYKPRGYVTTLHDELGRKTAAELIDCGCRVYPVGRLDAASEGLLLFTNDGALANALMHPKKQIEKAYEVTVRGALSTAQVMLERRIELDGRRIAQPLVRLLRENGEKATYEIVIHEGRNRQIRRMCEAAGLQVARLCRVREGGLSLGGLAVGAWRFLTENEVEILRKESGL